MIYSQGRFVWYELMTTDIEAAKAFYAKVVGWGTQNASIPNLHYTLFTARGASVSGLMDLSEEARKMGVKPSWIGYVGTNDVDATADRIQRLGGIVHVPPKDIPNISRFSIVADPQMATFGLLKWLEPGRDQPVELGAPGRVGWYELLAGDWEKAFAFYSALFGWQKADAVNIGSIGTYQLFSAGEHTIGGMLTKPPIVPAPFWLYYFNIGDVDTAIRRVQTAKGQIINGPLEGSGGHWIVQCADPQGAMFALVGRRRESAVGHGPTFEVGWSSTWNELSSKGRLLVTKIAPRS
jgi:predicted enzyme related to lactoylglutathione lyase